MNHASPVADDIAYDAHPVATLVLDADARIVAGNPAAQDLIGTAVSKLVGRAFGDLAPEFAERHFAAAQSLHAFDVSLATGDGIRAVDMLTETDAAGRTHIALLPLRKPGAGYAAAQPSTASAAVILAHEIKNPLSGIRGAAQLIAGGVSDPERFTRLICREVDRIAALIDRMEMLATKQSPVLQSASIFPAIHHALGIARAGFAADIAIEERHDPSLPAASIDPDSLVQIVLNLVKNAAEALRDTKQGVITITTEYRYGYMTGQAGARSRHEVPIAICISDNGPGVAPHILPDLFRPFASARSGGTGLGLALVDRLARDMGGTIDYERDDVRGVSHFRLMLSRAP